jgi:hypothetical protein
MIDPLVRVLGGVTAAEVDERKSYCVEGGHRTYMVTIDAPCEIIIIS